MYKKRELNRANVEEGCRRYERWRSSLGLPPKGRDLLLPEEFFQIANPFASEIKLPGQTITWTCSVSREPWHCISILSGMWWMDKFADKCEHEPVSYGSRRGFCGRCNVNMVMDSNLAWVVA